MFTGIGGFELGINRAWRNSICSEKEEIQNTKRDKSFFERTSYKDNKSDCERDEFTEDTSGTLFQNRQIKSNSITTRLDEIEKDTESSKQMEQGSHRDLSKRDELRDDEKVLFVEGYKSNIGRREQPICIGYSEIDKYSIQTYEKNFKGHKNYGDATKIKPEELPDFDMLCGGFPCQAFSIAGKRKGFEDTRGTLFFDIERILRVKRPKIVFLENVKGLLSHEKGETFRVIISRLEALGYNTQWMVLNSKFFGVPQNRERVFIIGSLRGTSRPEILPFRESNCKDEIVIKRIAHMNGYRRYNQTYDVSGGCEALDTSGGGGHQPCVINPLKGKTCYGWHFEQNVYSKDSVCRSLKCSEGSGNKPKIIHPTLSTELAHSTGRDYFRNSGHKIFKASNQIRRLTPLECERLQGFPDNWTEGVSDTQRYKQLGNAVTVNVIEAITSKLLPSLNG